jgi:hypothetical protein
MAQGVQLAIAQPAEAPHHAAMSDAAATPAESTFAPLIAALERAVVRQARPDADPPDGGGS